MKTLSSTFVDSSTIIRMIGKNGYSLQNSHISILCMPLCSKHHSSSNMANTHGQEKTQGEKLEMNQQLNLQITLRKLDWIKKKTQANHSSCFQFLHTKLHDIAISRNHH